MSVCLHVFGALLMLIASLPKQSSDFVFYQTPAFARAAVLPTRWSTSNRSGPSTSVVSGVLLDALEDCQSESFRFNHKIALSVLKNASRHLAATSPLFQDARLEFAGSAFEGTHVRDMADFDCFITLNPEFTSSLELIPVDAAHIWFSAKLRRKTARDQLFQRFPELKNFVSPNGYINVLRYKKWAFAKLKVALTYALDALPSLPRNIYYGLGAVGADIRPPNQAMFSIDFVPTLGLSNSQLKTSSMADCPDPALLAGDQDKARWFLVSLHDVHAEPTDESAEFHGVSGSQLMERRLILSSPVFRDVNRLMKMLRYSRNWNLVSFVLKHLVFTAYRESCHRVQWSADHYHLQQLLVESLTTLMRAFEVNRLDEFFFENPVDLLHLPFRNTSYDDTRNDVQHVIETLKSSDHVAIARLFRKDDEYRNTV